MEKTIVDCTTWSVMVSVTMLASAANQDWMHAHGRFVGAAAILAVLGAALKNFPNFTLPAEMPKVASFHDQKMICPTSGAQTLATQ